MAYSAFSISFLNLFVARDAGLFNKHGIDVELIQMAGPLPVAALAGGEIDYLTGYSTGIVATGRGAPLKGVMISLRKPPFFLVAEPSIRGPNDLTGKRIGVDRILKRIEDVDSWGAPSVELIEPDLVVRDSA